MMELFAFPNQKLPRKRDITTGEIIGHRVWHVDRYYFLRSYVQSRWVWYPNSIFTAVPTNLDWLNTYYNSKNPRHNKYEIVTYSNVIIGVHAWKREKYAEIYALPDTTLLIIGTIWMWGDVIEHERGYRSTHAKIRSLDIFQNMSELEINEVKKRYAR
ncbi:MAG TPA: hypothetical protein VEP90_01495 [Methylomirabilota bacterium]|nr:hypothetical protein [Methylomirabilota bacterium]